MADQRPEHSVDRAEFLRRTGALGLAGAAALGFPLLESRAAGAAKSATSTASPACMPQRQHRSNTGWKPQSPMR